MRLVHASLARMGTMSMSEAYRILGYKPHHYHQLTADGKSCDWTTFERAVDGKWPHIPGANPNQPQFTRKDWDKALGDEYDFFTDIYAHFTLDLITAYPEAKVVVVEREFESWWPSYYEICIEFLLRPWIRVLGTLLRYTTSKSNIHILERQYKGAFNVPELSMVTKDRARKYHQDFFNQVREMVPEERRLEYRLGDGWEPLCEFLGKDVPDVPFPRVNERAVLMGKFEMMKWAVTGAFGSVVAVVVGIAWFVLTR